MNYLEPTGDSNFRDTVPYPDEIPIERDGLYTDPTAVPEIEDAIEKGYKDELALKYAQFIREKMYGGDVRESIARFGLWLDVRINEIERQNLEVIAEYKEMKNLVENLETKFDLAINGLTKDSELILARYSKMFKKQFNIFGDRADFWDDEFGDRAENVKWTIPDIKIIVDHTSLIQSILDKMLPGDKLIFEKNVEYTISDNLVIKSNKIELDGRYCKLKLTKEEIRGITWDSDVKDTSIHHFIIEGMNEADYRQTAIGCDSGNNLHNGSIHNNIIFKVNVGISLNANLSGEIQRCNVYNNIVENIVGTEAGRGYGIHIANAQYNQIYSNTLRNCQRHSIYHSRGQHNDIYENLIIGHRLNVAENIVRPAIAIYRDSQHIKVFNNTLIDCFDGYVQIYSDEEGGDSSYIDVYENAFVNPQNNISVVYLHGFNIDTTYTSRNVNIIDNTFEIDMKGIGWTNAVTIGKGINVNCVGNIFDFKNVNQRTTGILLKALYDNALNNLLIENNTFRVNGDDFSDFRAIQFGGNEQTDTSTIKSRGNKYVGYYSANGRRYIQYAKTVTFTNENIIIEDDIRPTTRFSGPPTSGFYERGSLVYNSIPALNGPIGWVCVQEGAPGVWKTFGKIYE